MSTTFTGMLTTGKFRNKTSCSIEKCFILDNNTKKNDTHINKAQLIHNKFMNSNHRHKTIYVKNNSTYVTPVSNIFNFSFRTNYNRSLFMNRSADNVSDNNNLICKRLS
jgi:hypothetical protein